LNYAELRTDRMKLTFIEVETAFRRNVMGESCRAIARSLGVTEGALRFHFRKGASPREIRRLAWDLFNAEQAKAQLDDFGRWAVDKAVQKKLKSQQNSS
jgi:hypothetical protein